MANNRLILVHRPTGLRIHLGKRMAQGWYGAPEKAAFDAWFAKVEEAGDYEGQDDFVLFIEDASHAPMASDKFIYNKDGTITILT
ncbi:hypothetical protein [Rhizobium leguminosarum]